MTSRLSSITLAGWGGGLCSVDNGEKALPNQLIQADNVIINEDDSVSKRFGSQIDYNIAPQLYTSDCMLDMSYPYYQRGNNGTIQDGSGGGVIHTYAVNRGKGQYLYVGGKYIHSNGKGVMQTWTLGDLASVNVFGSPPLSRFLHIHNNRCFAGNGHNLYETEVDKYPDSAVDYFATGASWPIGDSNTNIIGVASIGTNLYIFKEDTIHIQTGYTRNERQNRIFDRTRGCLAVDSIKEVSIKGLGLGIIFLDNNGKLCFLTQSGVTEIGEAVQDILDGAYFGTPVYEAATATKLHRVNSAVIEGDQNYYLLGIAYSSDISHFVWDKCLCVHLDKVYQSLFGTRPAITLFKATDETFGGEQTSRQRFSCFDQPTERVSGQLKVASYTFYIGVPYHTISTFNLGTFQDQIYFSTYVNSPDRIQTARLDAGYPDVEKNWVSARLWSSILNQKENPAVVQEQTRYRFTQRYDRDASGTNNNAELVEFTVSSFGIKKVADLSVGLSDSSGRTNFEFSIFNGTGLTAAVGTNSINMALHSIKIDFKILSNRCATSPSISPSETT